MSLKDQLLEDMKDAMRAKDTVKLTVVRMIRSEVKNYEIDNGEADDEAVAKIVKTMVKQQKDALNDFKNADRQDLVEETEAKIEAFEVYLPKQMTDEELDAVVAEVVANSPVKDFGPLMGQVMKKVGSAADGGRVSQALKKAMA